MDAFTVLPSRITGRTELTLVTDELRRCGNSSDDEFAVAIDPNGDVVVTKTNVPEANTGPTLPFAVAASGPAGYVGARQHALPFGDGYLVGFDGGEWGGELVSFKRDGSGRVTLGDSNVHALVAMGPDLAISLEGLAHLSMNEGAVRWIERIDGTARAAGEPVALPDEPLTFASASDGSVYVLTWTTLVKITPDRRVQVVQSARTENLYANSMAIDPNGVLWIGMRQFVLRLAPRTRPIHGDVVHARNMPTDGEGRQQLRLPLGRA